MNKHSLEDCIHHVFNFILIFLKLKDKQKVFEINWTKTPWKSKITVGIVLCLDFLQISSTICYHCKPQILDLYAFCELERTVYVEWTQNKKNQTCSMCLLSYHLKWYSLIISDLDQWPYAVIVQFYTKSFIPLLWDIHKISKWDSTVFCN